MYWVGELGIAVGHSLASLALAVTCYGALERASLEPGTRSVLTGIAFGFAGSLMMTSPMQIAQGVIVDGRFLSIGLAAAFGGLPASLVSMLIVGLSRALLGGQGAPMGIASIVFAGIAGSLWRSFVLRGSRPNGARLAGLGAVLSLHAAAIAFIPIPGALRLTAHVWMLAAPIHVAATLIFGFMMVRQKDLIRHEETLIKLSSSDYLTRLPNRRSFSDHLSAACRRERDGGDGFCVLLLDIDHFKRVNDTFGHEAGDDALIAISETLAANVSKCDLACRYGGEEFAVFLLYSSPAQARDKAEKLRKRIEAIELNAGGQPFSITVSIGVSSSYGKSHNAVRIMKDADEALYAAKKSGRNKVVSCLQDASDASDPSFEMAKAA